jgi:hypothetical protein
MGIDNSDSDKLKISQGTALGTTDRMVFHGANVGIGTDSPSGTMHLYTSGASAINYALQNSERYWKIETDGGLLTFTDVSAGLLDRMVLDTSGNVGIGTDDPQELIHAKSSSSTAIRASGGNNNNKKVEIGYDNTNGPYLKGGSSGETGIQFYIDNTTLAGKFDINADFYTNDGTVHSLSDSRVKTDINDLIDGLDVVKQLQPRTFKYNEKSEFYSEKTKDEVRYGFIADEVQEVAPQYTQVTKGKIDGVEVDDLKSLSATKMIPMLVKAIQELEAKIAVLEG